MDAEIAAIAAELDLELVQVPVTWSDAGPSKVHVLRDTCSSLGDLLRISWRRALRPLVRTALESAPPGPVLDLGCGTDGNLPHLFGDTERTLQVQLDLSLGLSLGVRAGRA